MTDIITLSPDEWQTYRMLWLEALRNEPAAFGIESEVAAGEPESRFQEKLARVATPDAGQWLYFARVNGSVAGMLGAHRDARTGREHTAWLRSFYVRPEARGCGAGKALLERMLAALEADDRILKVSLRVTAIQERAIELYEAHGFQKLALHKRDVFFRGLFYDKWEMEKFLR